MKLRVLKLHAREVEVDEDALAKADNVPGDSKESVIALTVGAMS
jgi:hypothetical protein